MIKKRVVTAAEASERRTVRGIESDEDENLGRLLETWAAPELSTTTVSKIVRRVAQIQDQPRKTRLQFPLPILGAALAAGCVVGFIAPAPAAGPELVDLVSWLW